jgi:hypothetical protein
VSRGTILDPPYSFTRSCRRAPKEEL